MYVINPGKKNLINVIASSSVCNFVREFGCRLFCVESRDNTQSTVLSSQTYHTHSRSLCFDTADDIRALNRVVVLLLVMNGELKTFRTLP